MRPVGDMRKMENIEMKPIGMIRSAYDTPSDVPRHSEIGDSIAKVEVFDEFKQGLDKIEDFEKIWLIWQFHKSEGYSLEVNRRYDNKKSGVFASRSPHRPNPIAMTLVELVKVEDGVMTVKGADMVDGTPVLDIKPWTGNE